MYFVLKLRAGIELVVLFDWRIEKGGRKARTEREGVVREGGRDGGRVWRYGTVFGVVALSLVLWHSVGRCGGVLGNVALYLVLWRYVGHCGVVLGVVALWLAPWQCV